MKRKTDTNSTIHNESGAALMLILFVIVLLGITGTAMLQATTYGFQRTVDTNQEQQAFYRAEGALEIMLAEMAAFESGENSGPYFYLKNKAEAGEVPTYTIGGKQLEVAFTTDPELQTVTLEEEEQQIEVTLTAADADHAKLSRVLTVMITVFPETEQTRRNGLLYVDDNGVRERDQVEVTHDQVSRSDYEAMLEELAIDWSDYGQYERLESQDIAEGELYVFPSGTTNIEEMSIQGQDKVVHIPEDAIVYAQTVTLGGRGRQEAQLIIDGALISETFHNRGNSVLTINSGLITDSYLGASAAFEVNGESNGIDCGLLPAACRLTNGETVFTGAYTSVLLPESMTMTTKR